MQPEASDEDVAAVIGVVEQSGGEAFVSRGVTRTIIGLVGDVETFHGLNLRALPGVADVIRVSAPYKLVSRIHHPQMSTIYVAGVPIGPDTFTLIAGPCAVETPQQTLEAAVMAKAAGATLLRGGAYKPRTSPYAFQGLGEAGLKILADVREETGLPVVTEVVDAHDVDLVASYADMLQVGTRNMQNFGLLQAVGQSGKPVMLKRGMQATIEEWLMAAEYILAAGNPNVVMCERGIRSFDPSTRNTLDLAAVPVLRERTHLPVIVDPSHATGHRSLVRPMAVAGAAAGADGLIIEVHPDPPRARSDSEQSLSFPEFGDLMDDLRRFEYLRQPAAASITAQAIMPGDLARLRGRIDDVDARLAALVEERAQLSVAVQQTRSEGDHGHDVGRERALLERAAASDGSVLTSDEREQVYGAIIRAARSAQRRQAAADAAAQTVLAAQGGEPEQVRAAGSVA